MPWRPNKPCGSPGCKELVEPKYRFCKTHRSEYTKARDQARPDYEQEYKSPRYRAARKELLEQEPYCRVCKAEGRLTPAKEADHHIPLRLGGTSDKSNLVPLCQTHHRQKTASQR